MKVLVDTSVWSLALRRKTKDLSASDRNLLGELTELIGEGRAILIGPVRQELLSGLRDEAVFERLRDSLRHFPDETLGEADYEEAARLFNVCQRKGISGTAVDLLLCAVSIRLEAPLFTTDSDFSRYAAQVPLKLHNTREST